MFGAMYPNGEVLVDNCRHDMFGSTPLSCLEETNMSSGLGSYIAVIPRWRRIKCHGTMWCAVSKGCGGYWCFNGGCGGL